VTGNITGLKQSHRRILERTYMRRLGASMLLTPELARHMAAITAAIGRQVGILVDRQGDITEVFVGEPQRIYLPDLGRARAGLAHRRGLRHIHTVLGPEGLHRDDLADLSKLRLDAVVSLAVGQDGLPQGIAYAYTLPGSGDASRRVSTHEVRSVYDLDVDFAALMASLEAEQGRHLTAKSARKADDGRTQAVIVGVYPDRDTSAWRLAELRELAQTAGVNVVDEVVQIRRLVDSKFVLGRGKLEEAVLRCLDVDAELLIVDHCLTPAQARAIAAMSDLKVLDRTQLILDIFAQHAKSRDGKLQVELAQLKYRLPRLTDMDAGLSRLTGGIGGQGPGETKLEVNRRRARDRIARLEREIDKLSQQRDLRRQRRQAGAIPIVSIVGYTNAGKSTLLNRLTQSKVLVADQLFATLDPTSRRLRFPREREAVITDTVGLIRDLPPDLMKAFRATLEELEGADLLLHVVDVSDPAREEKVRTVVSLLADLELANIPSLLVYNKADMLPAFAARALAQKNDGVAVSAVTGAGLQPLVDRIAQRLWQTEVLAEDDAWAAEARGVLPTEALAPDVVGGLGPAAVASGPAPQSAGPSAQPRPTASKLAG
jgi:GTP-binding protein HflX